MGSNLGEGQEAQQAPGEGCRCTLPTLQQQSWFRSCLHPPAATPTPPCPHRRATTPFPCASSAACLTTGKLGAGSHVEFKNKTSKRALRSLKKPKQIAPKSKHLTGLAQSAASPEAESAQGGSSTRQLQRRERGTRNWRQDGNH